MPNSNFEKKVMTNRDIWLRVGAGMIGAMAALLPPQYHSASSNSWLKTYEHIQSLMWMPPWSLLSLPALGLFLYLTRFHRGNYGLAFGAGAAIVKSIQNLQ